MTEKHLKILLIEDLLQDAELIKRAIEKSGYDLVLERVETAAQMKHSLETGNWDLILSDFRVENFGAVEALDILKKSGKNLPFIVVSRAIGEETAVELLKSGTDDLVMKSKLDRLVPAIERSMRTHHASFIAEQAQSSREHLIAVVSHDLKNPLGGISLNLQVALKKLEEASKTSDTIKISAIKTSLERAQKSSQRMLTLIQGILDQTNIQAGKLALKKERSSVSMLMQELSDLFQPLAAKNSIFFEIREESEDCPFPFDFERIFQALGNLVGNSIKFTPAGGTITVWYESSPNEVSFFVRDTGKGIPVDQHSHIFKRFWQAKHTSGQGLGLGLSICRGIVEGHHGRIEVLSSEGKGSTFKITLPRTETSKVSSVETQKERILIIDDDESLGETIADTLRDRGFQVDWVMEAEKGIELLTNKQAKFSLVVADYRLPGMNGGEFAKTLRRQKTENALVPIILCSAEPDIEEMTKTLPVDATLAKPADLTKFISLVEQTLRKKTSTGISAKSINTYLTRRIEDLQSCLHALESSDYETIRSIAHRIKGSASTFGFPELSEIARALEQAVSTADSNVIRKSTTQFENWVSEHPPNDLL
jgi:signal transduction histidine kinase/HPt (histidine-containing phosphotransfer) domain-containing protein